LNQVNQPRFYRVIAGYESPYTAPFFLKKGETVQIGRRDDEWPGWVWCTNAAGESRWTPESYVRGDGPVGQVVRDYEATELAVKVGEVVTAVLEESGWLWCTNQSGQSGWIPKKVVERNQSAR
jgi:uncharacterized protein YgiM (DUF1202 family)